MSLQEQALNYWQLSVKLRQYAPHCELTRQGLRLFMSVATNPVIKVRASALAREIA